MAEITKPLESKTPYDFESAQARKPVDVAADTKVGGISAHKPNVDLHSRPTVDVAAGTKVNLSSTSEADTQVFKNLEKKAQASRAPARTIATEVAEVRAPTDIPNKPLSGQGEMADKPVALKVRKVNTTLDPDKVKAFKAAQKADKAAKVVKNPTTSPTEPTANVMTSEGSVEPASGTPAARAAAETPKPAGSRATSAEDLGLDVTSKPAVAASRTMTAGDIGLEKAASLGQKFKSEATALAKAGGKKAFNFIKSRVQAADPTAAYRELKATKGAARTSLQVAGSIAKGGYALGKGVAKGIGEGVLVDFAGSQGWKVGTEANKLFTNEETSKSGRMSSGSLEDKQRQGAKYGLNVSGGDFGAKAVGKALLRGATFGQVDLGSDLNVTEKDPSLRAKRLKAGQAKYEAETAKRKATSDTASADEDYYNKLKQTASRDVIKGSYKG